MRVALFTTCLVDALFPDAGRATVQLLERLGQPVEFPLEQTCCGQMHANSGYFEVALVERHAAPCAAGSGDRRRMIARPAGHEQDAGRAEDTAARTDEVYQSGI